MRENYHGCDNLTNRRRHLLDEWPIANLTGFRDPYAFTSPTMSALLENMTATGDNFLTISSGVHTSADPSGGPRLLLYRQTNASDFRGWTYIGPLVSVPASSTFSSAGWSGNFGVNFETACVLRLNENGESLDKDDTSAVDFVGFGTEGGRGGSHEGHWPLCNSTLLCIYIIKMLMVDIHRGVCDIYSNKWQSEH